MGKLRARWARIVVLGAGLLVVSWGISLLMVLEWERTDETRPTNAIVVLGAAQYAGHPSPVLKARLDHGITLWQKKMAPVLILTGGRGSGDTTSEAEVGRRYAIQRGVPTTAIQMENTGRTTSQSMDGVAALMRTQPGNSILLVSDPFHMLRLTILARRHGLVPYVSPTRTSPIAANADERWRYAFGESIKAPFTFLFERSGE